MKTVTAFFDGVGIDRRGFIMLLDQFDHGMADKSMGNAQGERYRLAMIFGRCCCEGAAQLPWRHMHVLVIVTDRHFDILDDISQLNDRVVGLPEFQIHAPLIL